MIDRITNLLVLVIVGSCLIWLCSEFVDALSHTKPWGGVLWPLGLLPLLLFPIALNYVRHGKPRLWN